MSSDILVEREKNNRIIYMCGIYGESLPHHLLNSSTIVSEMSYAARDALGGVGWDVSSLQSKTLVMQNRIIIQVNHKPKLLVEGRIMWMERT